MTINYKYTSIIFLVLFALCAGALLHSQTRLVPKCAHMDMSSEHTSMSGMSGMDHSGGMSQTMSNMTASLQGKVGDEFDKTFLQEMIVHHQGAVDMAKLVLQNSKRPELLQLAASIISSQSKETEDMKSWQGTWFPGVK